MVRLADNFRGRLKRFWTTENTVPERVSFEKMHGRNAVRLEVRPKDIAQHFDGKLKSERTELGEGHSVRPRVGRNLFYSFHLLIPHDFPQLDNRTVISQVRQNNDGAMASPFISFRYIGGKLLFSVKGFDGRKNFERKHLLVNKTADHKGKWIHLVVGFKKNHKVTGRAQVWVDGVKKVDYNGAMGYPVVEPRKPSITNFRIGIYRNPVKQKQALYFASFRRGKRLEDVVGKKFLTKIQQNGKKKLIFA